MIILFLISCLANKQSTNLGAVDMIEGKLCQIQLVSGEIIAVKSDICMHLQEGDMIKVERLGSR